MSVTVSTVMQLSSVVSTPCGSRGGREMLWVEAEVEEELDVIREQWKSELPERRKVTTTTRDYSYFTTSNVILKSHTTQKCSTRCGTKLTQSRGKVVMAVVLVLSPTQSDEMARKKQEADGSPPQTMCNILED